MKVSVTGKQIEVGEALQTHVATTLDSLVAKYFGNALEAATVFAREAHLFHCDIAVHVGREIAVNSHGEADDAYAAFDLACERMGKRLRRHKRRLRQHHVRGAAPAEPAMSYVLAPEESDESLEAEGDDQPLVIAEMETGVPTLSVSEAVMRIDLGEEPALLFRNRGHGGLNLVYRRSDGNIGWVDPDFVRAGPR